MNADERRSSSPVVGIECRSQDGVGTITGHAALFNSLSVDLGGFRERIAPGAFRRSLAGGADVKALINHDPSLILGRRNAGTLTLLEDSKGLAVEIRLPNTGAGRDIQESIRRGDVDQMSFAFRTISDDFDSETNIRTLLEVELRDVSVVTDPAYLKTTIELAQRDLLACRRGARTARLFARIDAATILLA